MRDILKVFRRRLPLSAQMSYGWFKHKFMSHSEWDDQEFIRYYGWLKKTESWSRDELDRFQLESLHTLVKHAYENVPYYRRVFDEHRVKPEDIVTQDDLQKLPLLTKADVRTNFDDMIARTIDRASLLYMTTSGTTGNPLGIYQDMPTAYLHELAFHLRQWGLAGYRFGDRFVTLRGNILPDSKVKDRKTWWDYEPGRNELILSSFDMAEEKLFQYIQKIEEFQPKFIQAYPSSIEILARFMKRNSVNITTIKAIFCASESLYPRQRKLIEEQFGCRIFASYGMTEKAAIALECEQHQGYHLGMEYGVFELLDQHDEPIINSGIPGRVVATGFDTFCMPLIRYVTEDIAEYATSTCSCKRESTLIDDFKGRLRELVFSKSGHTIPFAPVYASIHGSIGAKIRELRFIQERAGELVIQVAKAPHFSESEVEKELLKELYDRLAKDEFNLKVVFVDRVQRSERGKLGLLEQRLPVKIEYLDNFGNEMYDALVES